MSRSWLWGRVAWAGLWADRRASAATVLLLGAIVALFAGAIAAPGTHLDESSILLLAVVAATVTVAGLDVGRRRRDAVVGLLEVNGATRADRMGQAACGAGILTGAALALGVAVRVVWGLVLRRSYLIGGVIPDPATSAALLLATVVVPTGFVAARARRPLGARGPLAGGAPGPLGWCIGAALSLGLASVAALARGPYLTVVLSGSLLLLGGVVTLGAWAPTAFGGARWLLRLSPLGAMVTTHAASSSRVRSSAAVIAVLCACGAGALVVGGLLDAQAAQLDGARRVMAGAPSGTVVVRSGGPSQPDGVAPETVDRVLAPVRSVVDVRAVVPVRLVGEHAVRADPAMPVELARPALLTPEVASQLGVPTELAAGDRAVVVDSAFLDPGADEAIRLPTVGTPIGATVVERAATLGAPNVWLPPALVDRLGLAVEEPGVFLLDLGHPLTEDEGAALDRVAPNTGSVEVPVTAGGRAAYAVDGPPGARFAFDQGAVIAVYAEDRTASTADFWLPAVDAWRPAVAQVRAVAVPLGLLGCLVLVAAVLLNAAERRRDDELLVVQGAAGSIHRRLAAAEAWSIGVTASLAGVVLGGGWALLAALWFNTIGWQASDLPAAPVPWSVPWQVLMIPVAVPGVAAAASWLLCRPIRSVDLPALAEPW